MSSEPNVNFGAPTIFFDSHPEEQESYLYSYWSSLKSTFHIAFTGIVPPFHHPGTLRLTWTTTSGTSGLKDYELHEYAQVRDNFDVLLKLPEVRRVMIMGYSGQNPYILGESGRNPWVEKFSRMEREKRRTERGNRKADQGSSSEGPGTGPVGGRTKNEENMDNIKEGRIGKLVDIEEVLEKVDKEEEEKREREEEKIWMENEGLLSGEMV